MIPKISALAITYNEEVNVERYVKSLSFADEIIFIDSQSTDKTVELAQKHGVKVIQRVFDDFSSQRNFGIQQAKNNWVMFFDLDEIISPDLENEIIFKLKNPQNVVAFSIKRIYYFMNKKINFGGWQNDKVIRVFNKNYCEFKGLVHERVIVNGKVCAMQSKLEHFSYKSFDNYNDKLNKYSHLQAENLYLKKVKPNLYHFFIRPLYRFFWQYFFRLGVFDGKEGFILAYIHSFSVFKRYLQLWMMYRKID